MGRSPRFLLVVLMVSLTVEAQAADRLSLFDAQLEYTNPNPQVWRKDTERQDPMKGLLVLKHTGVADTEGNILQPILAIVYERLPGSIQSLADYVGMARQRTPFPVEDIIMENGRVIYFCRYERETIHGLVIGHFLFEGNGVQVMGDAPDSVYGQVEGDIKRFLDSIQFRKTAARE